jgi:hypothetical protein
MQNMQIPVACNTGMANCATCGQKCHDPITVMYGKKARHFCSGDCELVLNGGK